MNHDTSAIILLQTAAQERERELMEQRQLHDELMAQQQLLMQLQTQQPGTSTTSTRSEESATPNPEVVLEFIFLYNSVLWLQFKSHLLLFLQCHKVYFQ